MKKTINIFSLCLLLATAVMGRTSDDPEVEKTKSYSKSYAIGSSDKVSLSNKFGEMKINTWSKNEVKVDVNVEVKAATNEQAQRLLDAISIKDGKEGSDVFFKTDIKGDRDRNRNGDNDDDGDNKWNGNGKNEKSSFRINYIVYLPAQVTLEASNMFGNTEIGDFDGVLTLNSQFGSLTAGVLAQPKKVSVQFGTKLSTIESINGGKLSIQFSQALVKKITGEVVADFNQSRVVKIKLDNGLKKLDISNNFSEILIDAPKDISASFKVNTSFAKFHNESVFTPEREVDKENMYRLNGGSFMLKAGSGSIPINIKSNFGNVTLGHDLPFDPASTKKSSSGRSRA